METWFDWWCRWSLIAGRIPGRTANDVKNFWNTHISKKNPSSKKTTTTVVIKPRPRHLTALASKSQPPQSNDSPPSSSSSPVLLQEEEERDRGCDRERDLEHERWWREVLRMSENGEGVSFEDLLNVGPPEYDGGERVDVDGLMSDLLVDFHAWENIWLTFRTRVFMLLIICVCLSCLILTVCCITYMFLICVRETLKLYE